MEASIREIAPGLYQISIPLAFGLDYVHTFAVVEHNSVVLFDTGPDSPASLSMYNEILATIGRSLKDVKKIFLTHTHVDHCGFAGRIQEISGAKIYLSKMEYEAQLLTLQEPGKIDLIEIFLRQQGVEENVICGFCAVCKAFQSATATFAVDSFLADSQMIHTGGKSFRVLFTPGHTRGHVCFLLSEEGILLAGDNILPHITPNLSPDLSCSSFLPLENYLRSLTKIEDLQVSIVYPSHGDSFVNLKMRVTEIKQHHIRRKELARSSITPNIQTAYEISRIIFGNSLDDFNRVLAVNETYIHLAQLEKEGCIEKVQKDEVLFFKEKSQ